MHRAHSRDLSSTAAPLQEATIAVSKAWTQSLASDDDEKDKRLQELRGMACSFTTYDQCRIHLKQWLRLGLDETPIVMQHILDHVMR